MAPRAHDLVLRDVRARAIRGLLAPFDPAFRVLFNSYYNGVGDKHPRPERGLLSRPDLATVRAYRAHVDAAMARAAARRRRRPRRALIELGLHHEQQHQELILTDLKHLLSRNPPQPAYHAALAADARSSRSRSTWLGFAGGLVDDRARRRRLRVRQRSRRAIACSLAPFELASRPVTHGEFAAFIDDGGYRRPELWLSLGWDTVRRARLGGAAVLGARRRRRGARSRCTAWSTIDAAHAGVPRELLRGRRVRALGRRAAADRVRVGARSARAQPVAGNFVESRRAASAAAARRTRRGGPRSCSATSGNGRAATTRPTPAFAPAAGALGEYNGKFMCNQYVLRGGSCATPQSHIRATYRNFFPPDARWQFSGLRLARDAADQRRRRTPAKSRLRASCQQRTRAKAGVASAARRTPPARTCTSSRCGCARRPRTSRTARRRGCTVCADARCEVHLDAARAPRRRARDARTPSGRSRCRARG